MQFIPEISNQDFPRLLKAFLAITGLGEWQRRIAWLATQVKQNDLLAPHLRQIHSLELQFMELFVELEEAKAINVAVGSAERYRLFAFIAGTAMIYERLSTKGKRRLAGMVLGGLRGNGLTPLQQEITVATHLLSRGFEVAFSDMETGSGFDFLARRSGVELEVECKRVGLDLGRKVPRIALSRNVTGRFT